MREKILLLIIIILSAHNLLFADITLFDEGSNKVDLTENTETNISIDYRLNSISARDYSSTDGNFVQLSSEMFGLTGEIGKPQLPYSTKIIAVPEGAKVVTALKTDKLLLIDLANKGLNHQVFPAQPSVSKSAKPEDIVFIIDSETYRKGDFIPQEQVEVIELGYLRGMRLFEVNYYPVTYNPKSNTLAITQNATLEINFVGADLVATNYLRAKTFSPAFEVNYPATIFNYLPNRSVLESYPLGYVIVAKANYLNTLEPFIQWKTEQGYKVTVINTNVIGSTTGNISTAIQNVWNSATPNNPAPSYLLLVGDTPQIPTFTGPTDLPYVKLQGSDYLPEMYSGRFSARNTTELATMVNKTLLYEKYEMADPSYLARVTLIAGVDGDNSPSYCNPVLDYGINNYFNLSHAIDATTHYHPESGGHASSIIAEINAGLSFINYTGHGGTDSWGNPNVDIDDLNELTNIQQYPVVVGNACLTNKFDEDTSFGEGWLRATNGSVIYIGGSKNTYFLEDYIWAVGRMTGSETTNLNYSNTSPAMFDALFHENGQAYSNWANSAGSMVYNGNMAIQNTSSGRKEYYWEIYGVMGDPSLNPYIGVPQAQFPNYANALMIGATSLNITAAPYSYVSLTVDGVIIGTQLLDSNGSGTLTFPALTTSQTVKMVISRVDYQPYIVDIPIVTEVGPYLSLANYSVNDNNNNGLLEYGETASLNLVIENVGTATSASGTISFSESDPYLTLNSNASSFGAISAGSSTTITSVINFTLANNIPNNHTLVLAFVISANGQQYTGNISIIGKSYTPAISSVLFDDSFLGNGDGLINLGESFKIIATVNNYGSVASPANSASIQNTNYISFSNNTATIQVIPAGGSQEVSFTANASSSIPIGESINFNVSSSYPNSAIENNLTVMANILEIGSGNAINTHLPMESYYGYNYSQSIYTASELNLASSQINKIAYHYNGYSTWTNDIVIYMGNTTKNSFSSTSDWVGLTNLTEVYNGAFTPPDLEGWVEIELTTPFVYNGVSNLVIGFDENTPGYHSGSDEFYGFSTGSNRSIYYYDDTINPNPASPVTGKAVSNYCPNIRVYASEATSGPSISLSTTSLDFGEVIIGDSATRNFTISNNGGATLTGTITLPNNFTFANRSSRENRKQRTASQNFSIPAGNNQTYSITFIPTVELCYNGNVTISNNAGQYPSYISLIACGIKPTYASATTSINKTLAPNTQATYNLVIENTASGDLEVLAEITDAFASTTWLTLNSNSLTIPENSSRTLVVAFTSTNLALGTYNNNIYLITNDPEQEEVTIPVTLIVDGLIAPILVLSTQTLDFGGVLVGNSLTRDLTISNTGNSALSGTISLPDNFTFAGRSIRKEITNLRTASQNFSIPIGANESFSIVFTPTEAISYDSNITISHNGDELPAYVSLVANGSKPSYSSTTTAISKTLEENTQGSYNFVIENIGSADLEVLAEINDAERNSGGPDTYGYTWKDSNENDVDYNWLDISNTGAVVANGTDVSQEISLPFNFNFYGTGYSTVNICSNGFMSFTSTAINWENLAILHANTPNALIAPFWDDLKPVGGAWGNVYYQNFSTYTVVQWENVSHYHGSTPKNNESFQVILYNNGDFKYQYKTVVAAGSCTVGIRNHTGDDGLQLVSYGSFLHSQYAIMFTAQSSPASWLSLSSNNLLIPAGSSETITVSFNSAGLESGTYNKNLYLLTNDPDHEEITIPVTLNVGAINEPSIVVNKQSLDFGTVSVAEEILETFTITNLGAEALTGNISATNNFTITEARANVSKGKILKAHQVFRDVRDFTFNLATGASKTYAVSHSTLETGSYLGQIIITSNDPENSLLSIPLSLQVVAPASLSVNPQSLTVSLQADQTADRTVTISNTGDLDLNCSLTLQANENRDIFEVFSANFDDNDLSAWAIDYNYSSNHTWHITNSYSGNNSIDGSSFLFIDSDAAGYGTTLDDTIETPFFNIANYESITIDFDHFYNKHNSGTASVDFWTGDSWINIASWYDDEGSWSSPNHFFYNIVNNGYTNVKLRFHYDASWQYYWAIDNLVISGEGTPEPEWITMDSQFNNLTLAPHSSEDVLLNFSTSGFADGEYTATLNIQSNSDTNSNLTIPISLSIGNLILIAPENVSITINDNMATLSWDAVPGADYYKVFYSTNLESWTYLDQTAGTSYQHNQTRSQAHFYRVQAGKN